MLIGLTGGFGSGKSLVAAMFAEMGAFVVDTDALARQILDGDAEVHRLLAAEFGQEIMPAGGKPDRRKLAQIVFALPEKLRRLEEILHPRIRARWLELCEKAPQNVKVVEIPLLFEKKLEKLFNLTLCVSASLTTQTHRLKAKGFTEAQIQARMARQLPLAEKIKRADYVISNNGSIDFTRRQARTLAQSLNLF